jgi:hypothetical protein
MRNIRFAAVLQAGEITERRHLEAKTNGWVEIANRIANFVSRQQFKANKDNHG